MAKVPFSKLGLKKVKDDIATVEYNGQNIEVLQYLPIEDKLNLIADVILGASDDNRFYNPIKLNLYLGLEILFRYTNLSFTEKQKEDLPKLYDIVKSNGLLQLIIDALPQKEYTDITNLLINSADNIYKQMNSAVGIMEIIAKDYKNVGENTDSIAAVLQNPDNLTLVKNIADKLV